MNTAAEAMIEQGRDARDENMLNVCIGDFIERYKPKDWQDAYHFEVALHQIVRATYREAAKPYEKIMSAGIQSMSLQNLIKPHEPIYKPNQKVNETGY